jgi:tetratricopeptide (TPR) repeat protein
MLESVKQFGLQELEAGGHLATFRSLHHEYFLEVVEQTHRKASRRVQADGWPLPLAPEIDNLRAVLADWIRQGEAENAQRFAGALGLFWGNHTTWTEAGSWLEQAGALGAGTSAVARGRLLLGLGLVRWAQGDFAAAMAHLGESLGIHRHLGDELNITRCLYIGGMAASGAGDLDQASELLQEFLSLARSEAHEENLRRGLGALGIVRHQQGDLEAAELLYQEEIDLARKADDPFVVAMTTDNLAVVAYERKDWVRARRLSEQALAYFVDADDAWFLSMILSNLANLLRQEGNPASSARLQGFVQARCDEIGAKLQVLELAAFEETAAALQRELGKDAYQQAFEEGKALTQDEAVALALGKD